MNKIIYLSVCLASMALFPIYALDETDAENMAGGAVKILNTYQGSWKGWSDGCVNCDQSLASDEKVVQAIANKKIQTKQKQKLTVKESKEQDNNKDNQIKPIPKSLKRGYCGCSCGDKSAVNSEKNCVKANDADTSMKSDSATGSASEQSESKEPESTGIKKVFNMEVRDKLRSSDKNDMDVKDKKNDEGELEKQEIESSGAAGSDGIDSSEGKAVETVNEKSKFSIFSIWDSK